MPGGVFLNQGIARTTFEKCYRGLSFSDTDVFPDGELVMVNGTLRKAKGAGFVVRDAESVGEHCALTLRNWVDR